MLLSLEAVGQPAVAATAARTPSARRVGQAGAVSNARQLLRASSQGLLAQAAPAATCRQRRRPLVRATAQPGTGSSNDSAAPEYIGTSSDAGTRGDYTPSNEAAAGNESGEASAASGAGPTTFTAPAPVAAKPNPWAAARAAAAKEAAGHTPAAAAKGRDSWLYFTVPEKPVAGAPCVLYFNRRQSDPLRDSNRLQLHTKYNNWELAPTEDDRVDMTNESRIPKSDGVDFYRAKVDIPANAYEMNFVFSNGEGLFDNNGEQNYVLPLSGAMTRDLWIDSAPERAEAAWRLRKSAEAERAAEEAAAAAAAADEDDQRKAEDAVSELKSQYKNWQQGAVKQMAGRWRMVPQSAEPGSAVKLQYNRKGSPLDGFDIPADQFLTLKIGHNGWKFVQDVSLKRAPIIKPALAAPGTPGTAAAAGSNAANEEWWEAWYTVPMDAAVLNFVVTYYEHCDNNGQQDFKVLIDMPASATSLESWADSMLASLKAIITQQRKESEAAAAAIKRQRQLTRQAAQDKAEAVRRKQMRHVLFTQPEMVQAGEDVTVYYNPNHTVLNGRQQVWIRGGWNRWRHPKGFGPIKMTPPKLGEHFQATIKVPKDAYSMDFVFTDAVENGQYDSRGGLDYRLPVEKSVVEEPPLHVVHIAVEMAPICKVGGLGDVVTALGRAVQEQGHLVEVLVPRYDFFQQSPLLGATKYETEFDFGGTRVYVSTCEVEGLRCFFIEPRNGMFSGSVYQGNQDAARFDFFSRAALEFLLRTGRQPDIIHCHDWSSADVAKAYWTEYHQYGLWKPHVVFTIHNMDFGATKLGEAAYFSQRFTTVSPTYAWEIGGHPVIAPNSSKLMGVRNGIDIDIWDPETDIFLPRGYNADSVVEGKAAAREQLRNRLNLTGWGDKPLVGVVSRLTKQKGTHLIAHSCWRTLDRGGQFVLLGSAPDPKVQAEFNGLAQSHGGENAAFCFTFDEPLSHLIYAACDIIVVPSMFEPCGLTQMIAMRYGAVPVVRATGGLKDTVFDVDNDKERAAWEMEGSTDWQADGVDATNGFSFEGMDEGALDYAMNRALDAYYNDRGWFHGLQKRVMQQDWSWNKPAIDYIQLYYAALES